MIQRLREALFGLVLACIALTFAGVPHTGLPMVLSSLGLLGLTLVEARRATRRREVPAADQVPAVISTERRHLDAVIADNGRPLIEVVEAAEALAVMEHKVKQRQSSAWPYGLTAPGGAVLNGEPVVLNEPVQIIPLDPKARTGWGGGGGGSSTSRVKPVRLDHDLVHAAGQAIAAGHDEQIDGEIACKQIREVLTEIEEQRSPPGLFLELDAEGCALQERLVAAYEPAHARASRPATMRQAAVNLFAACDAAEKLLARGQARGGEIELAHRHLVVARGKLGTKDRWGSAQHMAWDLSGRLVERLALMLSDVPDTIYCPTFGDRPGEGRFVIKQGVMHVWDPDLARRAQQIRAMGIDGCTPW